MKNFLLQGIEWTLHRTLYDWSLWIKCPVALMEVSSNSNRHLKIMSCWGAGSEDVVASHLWLGKLGFFSTETDLVLTGWSQRLLTRWLESESGGVKVIKEEKQTNKKQQPAIPNLIEFAQILPSDPWGEMGLSLILRKGMLDLTAAQALFK